jgi:hypothetical protein
MQKVPSAKPISLTYNGRMFILRAGYDQPPYCNPIQATDIHTDVFIHENIKFEFAFSPTEFITTTAEENQPRGYGVSPYGAIFGAQDGHPSTSPTTGIVVLPTGVDGNYLDMSGLDENVQTVVHLAGRKNV